ncbi:hypothetical protein LB503_007207 [Fusarium chuoi]|nr:hypothetical protein LB503_007207 [Fusarium chuoi]
MDAEMIGILKTDVTRLHKLFVLEPKGAQRPRNKDMYWSFHYQLVLTIDGLNMKCPLSGFHATIRTVIHYFADTDHDE